MPKANEAFRNIGEVSKELGVKKHVLRFWEQKFPQVRPMKRGGGRRLYRPADVELLRGIRDLLQSAGYTIKGVQKILREQGVEQVKVASAMVAARGPEAGAEAAVKPLLLSPLQVRTLQKIVSELDACADLLKTNAGRRQSPAREKRAARG
ncbi:MAG TPA: MerR family transcriptional regulator [Hyphomicrobiaceae bacterium]|nr:MerR family transcriptional regulator [Hyphomicrobiaceae bacterium]